MEMSFSFIVFQCNPDRERVTYWKDGSKTKQVIKKDDFLYLAMNSREVYSQLHDACNSYSFYLWDALDNKIIHLTQKIEGNEALKYKNSLVAEFNKYKRNPGYSSQESLKKVPVIDEFRILSELGIETPSFEQIPQLVNSLKPESKSKLFDKVKQIFK